MPRPKAPMLDKTCERCEIQFQVPDKRTYRDRRFCSRACSNRATAQQRGESLSQTLRLTRDVGSRGYEVPRCPCGSEVPLLARSKYTYRKYCSPKCRSRYGIKRKPDPKNQVTFNCETCGTEVTRYRKYGNGANRFCSNPCAAKHTKRVRHYVIRDSDMVLDSAWEMLFAGTMLFLGVPVERFDRTDAIEWSPGQHYGPDFHLPTLGLCVEVKGVEDPDDPARWSSFRQQVGPLAVLDREGLDRLRHLDRAEAIRFLEDLSKANI